MQKCSKLARSARSHIILDVGVFPSSLWGVYSAMPGVLKVLGKSVGGENAKVPRYEVKW